MRTFFLIKESDMATAQTLPTVFSGSSSAWQGSLYAFLAEKQRRSGSNRTPDSYYRTLRHFFGSLQKAPDQVSPQDVFSFAHGIGLSGREPSPVTVGARLACISSFFKFLIRLDLLKANPCDPVERPKPRPGAPSGLSAPQVRQLLHVIPDTTKGRRDIAIVLTLVLTGRRRSEVVNLTAGDIAFDDSAAFYRYTGKGVCAVVVSSLVRPWPPSGDLLAMSARTSLPCILPSRSGRPAQVPKASPALPSTAASGAISRRPVSRSRASTSSATPPPSYVVTSASRSSP